MRFILIIAIVSMLLFLLGAASGVGYIMAVGYIGAPINLLAGFVIIMSSSGGTRDNKISVIAMAFAFIASLPALFALAWLASVWSR